MSTHEKSKKRRDSSFDKTKLWNIFDHEITDEGKPKIPLECVYRNIGDREKCELCQYNLAFSEEGFLTCTNNHFGIVYKDMLDQSPEWRYYGADDNNSNDPTRCGMPINPLLEESSYGCKVLCVGK